MKKIIDLGLIGETAVSLELMKRGYDVINLNTLRHNYQNIDLLCINPKTGKSVTIQVKTGSTKNLMTGFVSEPDGTIIPNLEEKVVGPWVFVKTDKNIKTMNFYVLTKEEIVELIKTSNNWYVNGWNRQLKSKPMIGIEVDWLEGNSSAASKPNDKKQHPEYKSTLSETSRDKWEKITDLLD